jgi:hypothetical protein
MKTAVAFLALAGAASAFAPASTVSSKNGLKMASSVFDDYVGAIDFRGKEFKFDPVSRLRLFENRTQSGISSLYVCQLMRKLTCVVRCSFAVLSFGDLLSFRAILP